MGEAWRCRAAAESRVVVGRADEPRGILESRHEEDPNGHYYCYGHVFNIKDAGRCLGVC